MTTHKKLERLEAIAQYHSIPNSIREDDFDWLLTELREALIIGDAVKKMNSDIQEMYHSLAQEHIKIREELAECRDALESYLWHDKTFGGNLKASSFFAKWDRSKEGETVYHLDLDPNAPSIDMSDSDVFKIRKKGEE